MTKKQARILIGTTIAFLIIGAGLFTGWFFSTHKIVSVQERAEMTVKKAEPNFNTYDISPPSRATVLQTHDMALEDGSPIMLVPIPKKDAANIKTGQKVLLYTAENVALETLGMVSAVALDKDQPETAKVVMTVQPDTQVDLTKARRASIVTNRIPAAARLPLSALIQNEKNEPFVWLAVQNRDGTTTAYLQQIYVESVADEFFVISEGSHRGTLYILNPDDALRDGQKINTKYIAYQGPARTEDSRIRILMENRNLERMAQKNMEGRQSAGSASGTNMSMACNAPPTIVQSFIGKIKSSTPTLQPSGPALPPTLR